MAMGLRRPDLFLLKRLGISSVDSYNLEARCTKLEEEIREFSANAAPAYVPPPPTRPATILRLIPGAAKAVKPEDRP